MRVEQLSRLICLERMGEIRDYLQHPRNSMAQQVELSTCTEAYASAFYHISQVLGTGRLCGIYHAALSL